MSDINRVLEATSPEDTSNFSTTSHPDKSLKDIAEDYFGDS